MNDHRRYILTLSAFALFWSAIWSVSSAARPCCDSVPPFPAVQQAAELAPVQQAQTGAATRIDFDWQIRSLIEIASAHAYWRDDAIVDGWFVGRFSPFSASLGDASSLQVLKVRWQL